MKFHVGRRLFNDARQCPSDGCIEKIDPFGDRLVQCGRSVGADTVEALATRQLCPHARRSAQRAPRDLVVEPLFDHGPERPYIHSTGTRGEHDYFDVTILHPLSSASRRADVETWPTALIKTACTCKTTKY